MLEHLRLEELFKKAKSLKPITAAVLCPESIVALEGAILAAEQNIITPILIGDSERIKKIARERNKDISQYQFIASTEEEATNKALKLVQDDLVQLIVKGSLHSDEFMRAIVHREGGMRTTRRMSHCMVCDVPAYKKLLILTDAGLNTFPTFAEKKDIVQNAIDLAIKLGIEKPKVALLSAVENMNRRIPSTAEWAELTKLAASGEITGGIVEGPLSLDLAISEQSAKTKKLESQVAGNADILVVPNIEVGNVLMKSLDYFAGALSLGIVLGAKIPIVLTSRSSSAISRAGSCMLAKFVSS
jgi:phosphate acetyltransferase